MERGGGGAGGRGRAGGGSLVKLRFQASPVKKWVRAAPAASCWCGRSICRAHCTSDAVFSHIRKNNVLATSRCSDVTTTCQLLVRWLVRVKGLYWKWINGFAFHNLDASKAARISNRKQKKMLMLLCFVLVPSRLCFKVYVTGSTTFNLLVPASMKTDNPALTFNPLSALFLWHTISIKPARKKKKVWNEGQNAKKPSGCSSAVAWLNSQPQFLLSKAFSSPTTKQAQIKKNNHIAWLKMRLLSLFT